MIAHYQTLVFPQFHFSCFLVFLMQKGGKEFVKKGSFSKSLTNAPSLPNWHSLCDWSDEGSDV